ncbi:hypothetical protein ACI4BE_29775, partial [Klebsiella pneumoniae]|uniref:hypothetical protein n=1 Tax=Klebsiella pneumoniae TaxID=573 RepID=UPI00385368CA
AHRTAGTTSDTLVTSLGCDSIVTLSLTVNPLLPVSVSITASRTSFCTNPSADTLNAAVTNGGTAPVYQWYKNGTAIGTNS